MLNQSCKIMGIINLTPDSFSDGGKFSAPEAAVSQIQSWVAEGVDYIDLGAESTRPGAMEISKENEWTRLKPVLEAISRIDLGKTRISIDSKNPVTQEKAVSTGMVDMINDVSGIQTAEILKNLVETAKSKGKQLEYIAMHMHGIPSSMQDRPLDQDESLAAVERFFYNAQNQLNRAGILPINTYLDPGIGFGKDDRANLSLCAATARFAKNFNIAIGVSRKSFIGRLTGIEHPVDRDHVSNATEFGLVCAGAKMIRTHTPLALKKWLRPQ